MLSSSASLCSCASSGEQFLCLGGNKAELRTHLHCLGTEVREELNEQHKRINTAQEGVTQGRRLDLAHAATVQQPASKLAGELRHQLYFFQQSAQQELLAKVGALRQLQPSKQSACRARRLFIHTP
ncbi:hypothetical protein DUNSADRAFT_472 [Dunaliella salina]|uniref:Encoded protein n=1 Tax=Dunaliella salina TaxID=3046 RepID=A0ABQ7FYW5_DUNSA|nr:hypothetical protein DUNSADRAFT_472 [Dunaliella salina]|eukprot:KAF5827548.1 hypothetical protein DUNSADRAFT_472 [Dunaliella salina]